MIQRVEVCYLEVDVLHPKVLIGAEGYGERYGTNSSRGVPCDDAIEWSFAWDQFVGDVQSHLLQNTRE
jgi:hypothetical protein